VSKVSSWTAPGLQTAGTSRTSYSSSFTRWRKSSRICDFHGRTLTTHVYGQLFKEIFDTEKDEEIDKLSAA